LYKKIGHSLKNEYPINLSCEFIKAIILQVRQVRQVLRVLRVRRVPQVPQVQVLQCLQVQAEQQVLQL
jgi:hypothetical protein